MPALRRILQAVRVVLLALVLLFLGAALPVAAQPAPQVSYEEIAPYLGDYQPNSRVELRGAELFFVRPPFESALLPEGDGRFRFTAGWLAGRVMRFATNPDGGGNIMLQADDGSWSEFARQGPANPAINRELNARLAALLDGLVAAGVAPGVALAAYIPGQGLWTGARGLSNRAAGIPAVPGDHFRIASITKPFVAVVVLQLAQEGRLGLDDPLAAWLPGLVPNGEAISLRQLLNHTSGLYDYLDEPFMDVVLADPQRVWTPEELVAYSLGHKPYFAPGTPGRWRYSNTNYVLLGLVAERAGGLPLAQAIRQRVIAPLELRDTFFTPDEQVPGGIVRGYIGRRDVTDLNYSYAWAAGNMVTSVTDLTRFAEALFAGRLLGPEMQAQMLHFVDTHGAWGRGPIWYGLGLIQDYKRPGGDDDPGELAQGHAGTLAGFRSGLWYLPERGVIIAVTMNAMYAKTDRASDGVISILRERGWQ